MAFVRLFGHPVVERDGARAPIGVSAKAVTLLALLAANPARPLSREWLSETLWPDAAPADARANLRRHVHLLTKALGEEALTLTHRTAQWNAACSTGVDVVEFEALESTDPAAAADRYAGELCAGISDGALEELRLRYRSRYEALLQALIEAARRNGDDAALALYLSRAIAHDPLDEEAVRALMSLRRKRGDRAGAIREYNALAAHLRSELGVEPQAETTALFSEILSKALAPATPHNLANATTSFVGRERELADIVQALRTARIVTLTGPGGIGKSRLALRCGFDMLAVYPDGVWFVDLEHVSGESEVWERIADVLHAGGGIHREAAVCKLLARRRTLIVLDTCEHLPQAARSVAERIAAQTSAAVLATSRRRLEAQGERVIEVPALDIPPKTSSPGDSPLRYAAYRLFVERAVLVSPGFSVDERQLDSLRQLLHGIDGLPLAIEVVASRANVLSIEGMRKRLHAAMSIDQTIAWSYELLSEPAQLLLVQLSVFCGTFDADDVEGVCGHIPGVLDALFELADASLVSIAADQHAVRYRLLETTRAFASKRLGGAPWNTDTLLAHAEHFAKRADGLAALTETQYARAMDDLLARMDDDLSALEHCALHRWIALGLRILEGLHRCALRKHFTQALLESAVALLSAAPPDTPQPRLHRLIGMFASVAGRQELAMRHQQTAADLYVQAGDEARACDALSGYAVSLYLLGRYDETELHLLDVLQRSERIGERRLHAKTLARMGSLYLGQGDFQRAFSFLAPGVDALRELDELGQLGYALKNLAVAAFYNGNFAETLARGQEVLHLPGVRNDAALSAMLNCLLGSACREMGDIGAALQWHLAACAYFPAIDGTVDFAECLEDIGTTLVAAAEWEAAAHLLGFADGLRRRIGALVNPGLRQYYDASTERLRGVLGARADALRRAGALFEFEEAMALIRTAAEAIDRRISQSDRLPAPDAAPATPSVPGT